MKKSSALLLIIIIAISNVKINAQSWSLTGNTSTVVNTNFIGTKDNKAFVVRTNNIERMRIGNTGNVGIGTSTLDGRLTVASTNQLSLTTGGDFIIGSKAGQNMAFNYNVIQGRYGVAANGLFLNYYGGSVWIGNHKGDGSLPVFYASPGGSAAVGSSNYDPNYALTINTSLAGNGIFVTDPYKGFILNATKSGEGEGILIRKTSTSSTASTIYSYNGGLGAGIWGVGTTGNGVYGSSTSGNGISGYSSSADGVTGSSTNANGASGFANNGNGVYGFSTNGHGIYGYSQANDGVYGNSANAFGVHGYSYNNTAVYGESPYGVGVTGASDNWYGITAFSTNHDALFAQTNNIYMYAGYFSGGVYANAYWQPSDKNLKQNIQDFYSAMNIINQLHPKQYDYRHDGSYELMSLPQGGHYGLIAQDLEKILPNLVKNSKFDVDKASPSKSVDPKNPSVKNDKKSGEIIDFKALNYTEFIPIMIKGMQELQEVNDKQEQRIETLEKAIEKLSGNSNTSLSNLSFENSSAYLKQNTPNPFTQNTIIYCNVPPSAKLAQLIIYNQNGNRIKSFNLTNGINNVTISAASLSSGQYVYSLFIDGKNIESKKMILTK